MARGADGAQGGRVLITSTANTELTNKLIDTSGIGNSSAGNAVVWSDNRSRLSEALSLPSVAELGGDGANVEVSGHRHLTVTGLVDLKSSRWALSGTLLLDPGAVTDMR